MLQKKILVVVGGPTASGKTGLAIRLSRRFHAPILSCDSRQFFREMSIGTAKPTAEELAAAPHEFIGQLSIEREYSVGAFERDALARLAALYSESDIVILTGGSGLYLKALCEGLDAFPAVPVEVRETVEKLYAEGGLSALQAALKEADPVYYAEVDVQNPHRLLRALAVCRASGRPFSSFRQNRSAERPFTPVYLQMHWPRPQLYERINRRVDQMIEQGLLEETRRLLPYRNHTALQTVGYQEMFAFLDGEYDWETAVELVKRNSRRYAKRQLTWMRRDGFWKHFHPSEWDLLLEYLHQAIQQNWRWAEHEPPGPAEIASLYPVDGDQRQNARILALYGNDHLLAAMQRHSFKHFETLDQMHFAPDLPSGVVRFFLHEAVARAEEGAVYARLPVQYHALTTECGLERMQDQIPPELQKPALLPQKEMEAWYWRDEFRPDGHPTVNVN